MAKNIVQSGSYLLCTQVIKPQIIQKPQNQSCTQIYMKQNIHKHRTQNFQRISPLLKKHIRLGHAGIVDHSVDLSIPDFFLSTKERNGQKQFKKIK